MAHSSSIVTGTTLQRRSEMDLSLAVRAECRLRWKRVQMDARVNATPVRLKRVIDPNTASMTAQFR